LQREAFLQVARADASRVEALQKRQRHLHGLDASPKLLGDGNHVAAKISGVVHQVDQVAADEAREGIGRAQQQLVRQMLGETGGLGQKIPEFRAVARRIVAGARGHVGQIAGGFARRVVPQVLVRRFEGFGDGQLFVDRRGQIGTLGHLRRTGKRRLRAVPAPIRFRERSPALVVTPLQKRVLLQLPIYENLQIEVGELQQLDGLLQLRGNNKGLALSQLQPCPKRHTNHPKPLTQHTGCATCPGHPKQASISGPARPA
jgi:hypothetical protein